MKRKYITPALLAFSVSEECLLCASGSVGFTSTSGDNNAEVLSRHRFSSYSDDFDDEEEFD